MNLFTASAVFIVVLIGAGAGAEEFPAGLEIRDYAGWNQSVYLNATETPVQAVIVPAIGGRVVHFSLNGENILFENAATEGKIMGELHENLWLGGYQCDIGRGNRSLPARLDLLQGPNQFTMKDFTVHVAGTPDAAVGVAIDKDFVLAPDTGDLGVMQHLRNISSNDVSYFLCDHTLCKGGGFAFFPLNPRSRFKAGWSQLRRIDGKDIYDGGAPNALQVRVLEGVLVAEGFGDVTQIGADSAAGWIAYTRGKLLLVKYFPAAANGNYGDSGNTVELYIDQRAIDLMPLSPETKIAPGKEYLFPEKWMLIELQKEAKTWEDARKLVSKIPASPFHS